MFSTGNTAESQKSEFADVREVLIKVGVENWVLCLRNLHFASDTTRNAARAEVVTTDRKTSLCVSNAKNGRSWAHCYKFMGVCMVLQRRVG
jgi:hypothetical protein